MRNHSPGRAMRLPVQKPRAISGRYGLHACRAACCFLLLCLTTSSAQTNLIKQVYPVQPTFADQLRVSEEAAREESRTPAVSSAPLPPGMLDAKDFFARMGVPFPENGSAFYDPTGNLITFITNPEAVMILHDIMFAGGGIPGQVEVQVSVVRVAGPGTDWRHIAGAVSPSSLARDDVHTVRLIESVSAVSRSGQNALSESLFTCTRLTEPEVERQDAPQTKARDGHDGWAATETSSRLSFTATVGPDNETLDIVLEWHHRMPSVSGSGVLALEKRTIHTSVTLRTGESVILQARRDPLRTESWEYVLLTARRVDAQGAPYRHPYEEDFDGKLAPTE